MRLPFSKVYRAFPELDRFDDPACRAYVREAARRVPVANLSVKAAALAAAIFLLFVGVIAGANLAMRLTFRPTASGWAFAAAALVWGLCLLPGPLVGAFIRDRWVRSQLKLVLRQASCPACGYSLLGLVPRPGPPPEGEFVVCPECGECSGLASRGLTRASLMAPGVGP